MAAGLLSLFYYSLLIRFASISGRARPGTRLHSEVLPALIPNLLAPLHYRREGPGLVETLFLPERQFYSFLDFICE